MEEEREEDEEEFENPETLQELCIREVVGSGIIFPYSHRTTLRERDVKSVIFQLTTPELKYFFLEEL